MYYKIAVTGPESSGKTTLALALADALDAAYAEEYARAYLQERDGQYTESDLMAIARGQQALEDALVATGRSFHLCDTDMVVLKVWSEFRFGRTDSFIDLAVRQRRYDLTLLCLPDIPWQPDPLRENPDDRMVLLAHYRRALAQSGAHVVEIGGSDFSSRLQCALEAIAHGWKQKQGSPS
ncbi:MAG: AAA family ATPase [Haliscomenobacter sp.]